jgi:hypothetical protein
VICVDTKRKAARSEGEQLLTLLNGWDPAGLLEGGARRDEYVPLIEDLLALLSRTTSTDEIEQWLNQRVKDHFKTTPKATGAFAKKLVTWYEITRREKQ